MGEAFGQDKLIGIGDLHLKRVGTRRIGLNFGGKWTDGTGMTENAIYH